MNVEPSETYKTLQGGDYIAIHTYLFIFHADVSRLFSSSKNRVIGILKNIA